jgi:hypothetical protein
MVKWRMGGCTSFIRGSAAVVAPCTEIEMAGWGGACANTAEA